MFSEDYRSKIFRNPMACCGISEIVRFIWGKTRLNGSSVFFTFRFF